MTLVLFRIDERLLHGQVIVGASAEHVIRRAVFFELACSFVTSGQPLSTIPEHHVRALRDYARDA